MATSQRSNHQQPRRTLPSPPSQGVGKGKRVKLAPSEGDLEAAASQQLPADATDAPVPMQVDGPAAPSTSGRGPIPLGDVKLPLELNTRVRACMHA